MNFERPPGITDICLECNFAMWVPESKRKRGRSVTTWISGVPRHPRGFMERWEWERSSWSPLIDLIRNIIILNTKLIGTLRITVVL